MCLLALALATPAWAFNPKDLLSVIAMPLAVAAVANVSGVPQSPLADLVMALNQANVPPTQFVEVIRYVPVALVDQNGQPFIAYVREQTRQGVTGDALVNAIADRLRTNYNVTPVLTLNGEPTTVVVREDYIPTVVNTGYITTDPLSLIGLPLAVAAVSDISGVSQSDLANLVAALNSASVPPVQEIQIIRYAPVALLFDNGTPFVQYVLQQTAQGLTGPALVPVVVQQLQTYYPAQTQIAVAVPPPHMVVTRDFAPPPMVVARVEEARRHPHGGPPGQIKKELGYQTGAEVVHGDNRGREVKEHGHGKREEGRTAAPMISSSPAPPPPAPLAVPAAPGGREKAHEGGPPAGGPPGQQKEKDKGKGGEKGHGKD
jgi:hypothetical protein